MRDRAFELAIQLRNQEQPQEALAILELLARQFPDDGAVHWYTGSLYLYELKQPAQALPLFRRATELKPESARASLGVFHSLWELDRRDEALEEVKRFQVLTDFSCPDYRKIIAEISQQE